MNTVIQIKQTLLGIGAAAGGAVAVLFGCNLVLMRTLLIFMAVDYASGLLLAAVFKRSCKSESGALCSKAGFLGLARKAGALMMLLIANQLDTVLETSYIQSSLCLFLMGNEGVSILENLGLMGVPYPAFLRSAIDALRKKID